MTSSEGGETEKGGRELYKKIHRALEIKTRLLLLFSDMLKDACQRGEGGPKSNQKTAPRGGKVIRARDKKEQSRVKQGVERFFLN